MTPSATSKISSMLSKAVFNSIFAITFTSFGMISLTRSISLAFLTNETATKSTSCSDPNLRCSLSFSVIAETDRLESGNATP